MLLRERAEKDRSEIVVRGRQLRLSTHASPFPFPFRLPLPESS